MNYVLAVSKNNLAKIKDFYRDSLVENSTEHVYFLSKSTAVTVTAYTSGKIMFQGTIAESEYIYWRQLFQIAAKKENENIEAIGSDEVGTGDFFGPIVVVSAYINNTQIELLKDLKIDDSKKLSDQQILKIGPKLKSFIVHKEVFLNNFYYNKLQKKGNNMNKIKALMHNRALNEISKEVKCDRVILDQFTPPKNYFQYLENEAEVFEKIIFETKAESKYLAVATASVLARYYFLVLWEQLEKKFNCLLPKGAGTKVDDTTREIIVDKGIDFLEGIAKLNFKTLEKAIKQLKKESCSAVG